MIEGVDTVMKSDMTPDPTQAKSSFTSYMVVSAITQTLMGFERRERQEKTADANERFQTEMQKLKNVHHQKLEEMKVQAMRNKMSIDRRYRLEEKFEREKLNELTTELKTLLEREFPLKEDSIPMIIDTIEEYRNLDYGPRVPLNVILLHALGNVGVDYNEIIDSLDKFGEKLGNVKFRRWCDKDVSRNAAIYNLHAVLCNIPTLIISPYLWKNKVYITIAMWDAQCETKPLIRQAFSINIQFESLLTSDGRKAFQKKIELISMAISVCARDSYSLLAHGLPPILPQIIEEDNIFRNELLADDNKFLLEFISCEYRETQRTLMNNSDINQVYSKEEKQILLDETNKALSIITHL